MRRDAEIPQGAMEGRPFCALPLGARGAVGRVRGPEGDGYGDVVGAGGGERGDIPQPEGGV